MLLQDLPYTFTPLVILFICLILFTAAFYFLSYTVWNKFVNSYNTNFPSKNIFLYSLGGGFGCSLLIIVLYCSLVPTVSVVDEDFNVQEEYLIYSNGSFVGISGIYIENQSNRDLHYVVVGSPNKYTIIPSKTRVKVPRLPERYFEEVPNKKVVRYRRTNRGRKRAISGPTIYLTY